MKTIETAKEVARLKLKHELKMKKLILNNCDFMFKLGLRLKDGDMMSDSVKRAIDINK